MPPKTHGPMVGPIKPPRMPNVLITLEHGREAAAHDRDYWDGIRQERQDKVDQAQRAQDLAQAKIHEFEAAIALVEGR
jgi:hypothetical protein